MSDPKKKSTPRPQKQKVPAPKPTPTYQPSRKDRLRPAELVIFSAILALFVGLVVLITTRQPLLAVICLGLAFIASLVILAMLSLGFKPNKEEIADLHEQDRREA